MKTTISEVEITGGSAHTTSEYSDEYKPINAFIGTRYKGWTSGGVLPQMVWYDFGSGNAFEPARVTFRGERKKIPTVWEFVGSNDAVCSGSGNWTILCQDHSDVIPQLREETKYCNVNIKTNIMGRVEFSWFYEKYRCLGINVISAPAVNTGVSNVRMWKLVFH